jgi:hypothetical protein
MGEFASELLQLCLASAASRPKGALKDALSADNYGHKVELGGDRLVDRGPYAPGYFLRGLGMRLVRNVDSGILWGTNPIDPGRGSWGTMGPMSDETVRCLAMAGWFSPWMAYISYLWWKNR